MEYSKRLRQCTTCAHRRAVLTEWDTREAPQSLMFPEAWNLLIFLLTAANLVLDPTPKSTLSLDPFLSPS